MSDIDIVLVDSLKALDPKRPIREADISQRWRPTMSDVEVQRAEVCDMGRRVNKSGARAHFADGPSKIAPP